jgi:hypothetical protein
VGRSGVIIKIGTSSDGEFAIHFDSNENLVFLEMNGVCSADYTREELKGILKEMVTSLEVIQ